MIEKRCSSAAVKTSGSRRLRYLPGGGKRHQGKIHGTLVRSDQRPAKRFMTQPKPGDEPLDAEKLAVRIAELVITHLKANEEWLDLNDVPDRFGISKSANWLRERWRRRLGAPRPSEIAKGTYSVRASEVEQWLDSLRAEDQAAILRRDALVSRQSGRTGRLKLDVPTQDDA